MATLTLDLLRRKSEHHTDGLSSLQELSLHQLNLLHLTPLLSQTTPHLRILYLHNNLLPSSVFSHLRRLKSLTYLNLTLNNVTALPPAVSSLEKLVKLDLTLNHIPLPALSSSLDALSPLLFLTDLYLTGNPATLWPHCRLLTIHRLPRLTRLDGKDVTRTERIEAASLASAFPSLLASAIAALADRPPDPTTAFTPDLRMRMYEESLPSPSPTPTPTPPPDLYHDAQARLSQPIPPTAHADGSRPSQRNTGRYAFTLVEEGGCWVLTVKAPRHLDTSAIVVDVHPRWLQVAIKERLLVLHVDDEVEVSTVRVQRVTSDGALVVKMRKIHSAHTENGDRVTDVTVQTKRKEPTTKAKPPRREEEEAKTQIDGLTEVKATRSAALEAQRAAAVAAELNASSASRSMAYDNDDDVPPLI